VFEQVLEHVFEAVLESGTNAEIKISSELPAGGSKGDRELRMATLRIAKAIQDTRWWI